MNFSHLLVGLAPRTVGSSKHQVAALQSDLYLYNVYIHVCICACSFRMSTVVYTVSRKRSDYSYFMIRVHVDVPPVEFF